MAGQLLFGAGDSVSFGTTGTTTANTTSFAKSSLSNAQVGDLLVAWIHSQNPSTGQTITPPSGWIAYGAGPTGSGSRLSQIYYYPIRTSTDLTNLPTTNTWTFSINGRLASHAVRATGIDLDNIEDVASASFSYGWGSTTLTISGITTVATDTLLVGGLYHQNSASTDSPDTTAFMTAFQEYKTSPTGSTNANTGSAIGYQSLTSAGATGDVSATFASTVTAYGGALVAFKVLGVVDPPPPSTELKLHFGAGDSTSAGTTGTSTASSVSFDKSNLANAAVGDLLVAWIHSQNQSTNTITPPSGWVQVGANPGDPSYNASRLSSMYYYKIESAGDITSIPSTITWTFSGSARVSSHIARATGVDLTNPVDVTSAVFESSGGSTTLTIPGITATAAPILLAGGMYRQNSGGTGSPDITSFMTSFETRKTSTDGSSSTTGSALGYTKLTSSGFTGDGVGVIATTSAAYGGELIAFRGIDTGSGTVAGAAVMYTSATDTLATGTIRYTSAVDTLAIPSEVRPFPVGYPSVTNMLAQSPFYVAHRAGSLDWPEHSLYAYSQSGFWGAGACELSVHRTSDGVWFGLHDATLDRTSGTSGYDPSDHTWAEVQTYMITAANTNDPGQPSRPYARWEEIMDAYYDSHVFFIDPKEDWAYSSELLDMMDAMPGNPSERFIAKAYGLSSSTASRSGWVYEARQRGYKSWGYFYQSDSPDNIAAREPVFDILGMDYLANQSAWTDALSYGKKVISHVVPNSTGANSAFSKGAHGVMAAGVQSIIPRLEY